VAIDWAIVGGLTAGALAGGGTQFGRLCTMSAIEDALVAGDFRGAKAWFLALAVAACSTQLGVVMGAVDLARSAYLLRELHLLGVIVGGLLFGLGMTLAGTCSFGLLVRTGAGDLRAAMTALIVGVFAFAATSGLLAPLREMTLKFGVVNVKPSLDNVLVGALGPSGRYILIGIAMAIVAAAFLDRRLRRRPRLLLGATVLGLAVTIGWWATSRAVDEMALDRPESLSFVAPVGRALLQLMVEPFRNVGFGVSALVGVVAASFAVAAWRGDFRWDAFDDAKEMRRHLFGAALMGIGGVFAHGCTIGQGLTAASALAVSAPIFIVAVVMGARVGLWHLIDGGSLWRLGRSPRP
jgi:uncharacterized protein